MTEYVNTRTQLNEEELQSKREMAIEYIHQYWDNVRYTWETQSPRVPFEDVEFLADNLDFHNRIWEASTSILPNLEVQVVVDAKNKIHVSSGSAGYVSWQQNPKGISVPIKCWIHTHPFGSAYFSGTDIRTVTAWQPLMETAYVLGGEGHYGHWNQDEPRQLEIYQNHEFMRTQYFSHGNQLTLEEEE